MPLGAMANGTVSVTESSTARRNSQPRGTSVKSRLVQKTGEPACVRSARGRRPSVYASPARAAALSLRADGGSCARSSQTSVYRSPRPRPTSAPRTPRGALSARAAPSDPYEAVATVTAAAVAALSRKVEEKQGNATFGAYRPQKPSGRPDPTSRWRCRVSAAHRAVDGPADSAKASTESTCASTSAGPSSGSSRERTTEAEAPVNPQVPSGPFRGCRPGIRARSVRPAVQRQSSGRRSDPVQEPETINDLTTPCVGIAPPCSPSSCLGPCASNAAEDNPVSGVPYQEICGDSSNFADLATQELAPEGPPRDPDFLAATGNDPAATPQYQEPVVNSEPTTQFHPSQLQVPPGEYLRLGDLLNQSVTWLDIDVSDSECEEEEDTNMCPNSDGYGGMRVVPVGYRQGVARSFSY